MTSALGEAIDFLKDFGFFDVILPFLLVFTIVFGILEKTRVFGEEEIDGKKYPKKNINAMIAFVIAFFTIAAKEVVAALQLSLPKVALALIIVVCFLMLAGSFMSDKEFSFEKRRGWKIFLTFVMFISVVLIFIDSFGYLAPIIDWLVNADSTFLMPLVTIAIIFGVIAFVVGKRPKSSSSDEESEE